MVPLVPYFSNELNSSNSFVNDELKNTIYNQLVKHPAKSDYELVAIIKEEDKIDVSRSMVYRVRQKFALSLDYNLSKRMASQFIGEFQQATDYYKQQIERLETLKKSTKQIIIKHKDGDAEVLDIPLEPMEILAIEKQQGELWDKILFLSRQGEAISVMRLMQDGKLKLPVAS